MDSATSAAVMIQRMTSFVVFFSSAIAREYSIPRTAVQVSLGLLGANCIYGFDAVVVVVVSIRLYPVNFTISLT